MENKIDIYKRELLNLMIKKMAKIKDDLDRHIKSLEPYPELLKDYGDYIENYNKIIDQNKNLELRKI